MLEDDSLGILGIVRSLKKLFVGTATEDNVPKEYRIGVQFLWHNEPQEWGGLNKSELIELVNEAADFFHIPLEKRELVKVLFADHYTKEYTDGTKATTFARNMPIYDKNTGNFLGTDIVLNRSMEVSLHQFGIDPKDFHNRPQPENYDYKVEDNVIIATLREPWEAVVWTVAEEINHASLNIALGNETKTDQASGRFKMKTLQHHSEGGGEQVDVHPNSSDLFEVTASRQVMRFLENIAYKRNKPDRARFFRQMYNLSLTQRMAVIQRTALVVDSFLIWTGYRPGDDEVIIESE